MTQDRDRGRTWRTAWSRRFTPDETRDKPVQSAPAPAAREPASIAGQGTTQQQPAMQQPATLHQQPIVQQQPVAQQSAMPQPSTGVSEMGATSSMPEMSAAMPSESQARRGLIALGALVPLAAFAVPGVRRTVFGAWQSGRQQAAEAVQSGTRQVGGAWRLGARQVAGQVEGARASREVARERRRLTELEQQRQLLFTQIERLERELTERRSRRGGPLRRFRPFLLSALISGGATLLYAPRPGTETREQLRQSLDQAQGRATEVAGQAKEQAGALQEQARQTLGQAKEQVSAVQDQARQTLGQVKEQAAAATPVTPAQIKEHMPVVGPNQELIGTVDHLDAGDTIKLTKDLEGRHHWIPFQWVTRVDTQVHLNRSDQMVKEEWQTSPPQGR